MLKVCAIAAGIKTYKLILNKKKKSHNKTMLIRKTKLDTTEVLVSKAIIDSKFLWGRL